MYKYLTLLCLFLVSCGAVSNDNSKDWYSKNGKLKVLTTTAMITDVVKQIGGDQIDVITLIQGELDPHSYQLVKGDDEKLKAADLIIYNGLNLEHGPSLKAYLDKSDKAIGLGNSILKDNPSIILHFNGQLDPHIWMDISLWAKTIPYITESLSANDPAHADLYRERADKLQKEMLDIHVKIRQDLMSIPESRRYLVTSHDAFNYFTRAYFAEDNEDTQEKWQKRFAAPEGLAPESQLSTTDIQEIIDHLRKYHIHILFPESNVSQDSIRKILNAGKEHGLELEIAMPFLYGDAMGAPGSTGDTYLKMIQHNAKMIKLHLLETYENKK
jgi:manganese/zinc/iron transport system substrate-binding protein